MDDAASAPSISMKHIIATRPVYMIKDGELTRSDGQDPRRATLCRPSSLRNGATDILRLVRWQVHSERPLYKDQWLGIQPSNGLMISQHIPGMITDQKIVSGTTIAALLFVLAESHIQR
jgi:hypothetical protein